MNESELFGVRSWTISTSDRPRKTTDGGHHVFRMAPLQFPFFDHSDDDDRAFTLALSRFSGALEGRFLGWRNRAVEAQTWGEFLAVWDECASEFGAGDEEVCGAMQATQRVVWKVIRGIQVTNLESVAWSGVGSAGTRRVHRLCATLSSVLCPSIISVVHDFQQGPLSPSQLRPSLGRGHFQMFFLDHVHRVFDARREDMWSQIGMIPSSPTRPDFGCIASPDERFYDMIKFPTLLLGEAYYRYSLLNDLRYSWLG